MNQIDMFDKQINKKSILNQIHPLFKLLLSFLYLILLTSINPYDIVTTLAMGIYLVIISIVGDLSIKNCRKQLKIVLLLLIIVGIANPIIDKKVIGYNLYKFRIKNRKYLLCIKNVTLAKRACYSFYANL